MAAISTVCITHRKGELLRETLTTLARTVEPSDEILVIDDGGDDWHVVHEVAARARRATLRYVRVPHEGYRLSLLCNIGVMLAAHERIVKIDGDVIPRPGCLAAYRRLLRPGSLVCGRIEWRLENGRLARDSRFDYERRRGRVGPRKSYGGNLGFMRADLLALGLFATEYHGAWGAEDADVGERYRASGCSVEFAFDAVAEHQWHPLSPHRSGARRNRRLLLKRVRAFAAGGTARPVRRDVLHVVERSEAPSAGLAELLEGLSLPHELWREPLTEVADRVGSGGFVLLLGAGRAPSPGTVDTLYAHLKSDPRCQGVAPELPPRGSILLRGSAVCRTAAAPWEDVRVLSCLGHTAGRRRFDGAGSLREASR